MTPDFLPLHTKVWIVIRNHVKPMDIKRITITDIGIFYSLISIQTEPEDSVFFLDHVSAEEINQTVFLSETQAIQSLSQEGGAPSCPHG